MYGRRGQTIGLAVATAEMACVIRRRDQLAGP
jgi:hypothetical protein